MNHNPWAIDVLRDHIFKVNIGTQFEDPPVMTEYLQQQLKALSQDGNKLIQWSEGFDNSIFTRSCLAGQRPQIKPFYIVGHVEAKAEWMTNGTLARMRAAHIAINLSTAKLSNSEDLIESYSILGGPTYGNLTQYQEPESYIGDTLRKFCKCHLQFIIDLCMNNALMDSAETEELPTILRFSDAITSEVIITKHKPKFSSNISNQRGTDWAQMQKFAKHSLATMVRKGKTQKPSTDHRGRDKQKPPYYVSESLPATNLPSLNIVYDSISQSLSVDMNGDLAESSLPENIASVGGDEYVNASREESPGYLVVGDSSNTIFKKDTTEFASGTNFHAKRSRYSEPHENESSSNKESTGTNDTPSFLQLNKTIGLCVNEMAALSTGHTHIQPEKKNEATAVEDNEPFPNIEPHPTEVPATQSSADTSNKPRRAELSASEDETSIMQFSDTERPSHEITTSSNHPKDSETRGDLDLESTKAYLRNVNLPESLEEAQRRRSSVKSERKAIVELVRVRTASRASFSSRPNNEQLNMYRSFVAESQDSNLPIAPGNNYFAPTDLNQPQMSVDANFEVTAEDIGQEDGIAPAPLPALSEDAGTVTADSSAFSEEKCKLVPPLPEVDDDWNSADRVDVTSSTLQPRRNTGSNNMGELETTSNSISSIVQEEILKWRKKKKEIVLVIAETPPALPQAASMSLNRETATIGSSSNLTTNALNNSVSVPYNNQVQQAIIYRTLASNSGGGSVSSQMLSCSTTEAVEWSSMAMNVAQESKQYMFYQDACGLGSELDTQGVTEDSQFQGLSEPLQREIIERREIPERSSLTRDHMLRIQPLEGQLPLKLPDHLITPAGLAEMLQIDAGLPHNVVETINYEQELPIGTRINWNEDLIWRRNKTLWLALKSNDWIYQEPWHSNYLPRGPIWRLHKRSQSIGDGYNDLEGQREMDFMFSSEMYKYGSDEPHSTRQPERRYSYIGDVMHM